MRSASEIILQYVCPAAGMICANVMFSAPYTDVRIAVQKQSLGDLNPIPWAFMLGNCLGWVTYAMLLQNWFIFWANAPGMIISVYLNLQAVKLQYAQQCRATHELGGIETEKDISNSEHANGGHRKSVATTVATSPESAAFFPSSELLADSPSNSMIVTGFHGTGDVAGDSTEHSNDVVATNSAEKASLRDQPLRIKESMQFHENLPTSKHASTKPSSVAASLSLQERLVLIAVMVWTAIITMCTFSQDVWSDSVRKNVVGTVVNLNLVFFYGAPLSTIWAVLQTRSSVSLHVPTMLTNTANGSFWCAYGVAVADPFIYVPNGLGALLGLIQFFLRVVFPVRVHKSRNDFSIQDAVLPTERALELPFPGSSDLSTAVPSRTENAAVLDRI